MQGTDSQIVIAFFTSDTAKYQIVFTNTIKIQTDSIDETVPSSKHFFYLKNLNANQKYTYIIKKNNVVIKNDVNQYFKLVPQKNDNQEINCWITGDCGDNSANQRSVRDALLYHLKNKHLNAWLLAGDNAYENGTFAEYQSNFFDNYKSTMLPRFNLYPAPGNHDYANDSNRQKDHNIPYYQFFPAPIHGECGGFPSNNNSYYSFNIADIHFVSMDSYGFEDSNYTRIYDTLGAQIQWLKKDLGLNTSMFKIVYFHHPPFTHGSHNSDTEIELIKIRENTIRIFERLGVDLVICGHSHSFERSYLQNNYYESSEKFNAKKHLISNSSAFYNNAQNSCPYIKNNKKGTMYIVSGCAGKFTGKTGVPLPNMFYTNTTRGGGFLLTKKANKLIGKFIAADSVIYDSFVLFKNASITTHTENKIGDILQIKPTWEGTKIWNKKPVDSFITYKIPHAFEDTSLVIEVTDNLNCLKDSTIIVIKISEPKELLRATYIKEKKQIIFKITILPDSLIGFQIIRKNLISNERETFPLILANNATTQYNLINDITKPGIYNFILVGKYKNGSAKLLYKVTEKFYDNDADMYMVFDEYTRKYFLISNFDIQNAELLLFASSGKLVSQKKYQVQKDIPIKIDGYGSGLHFAYITRSNKRIFFTKLVFNP